MKWTRLLQVNKKKSLFFREKHFAINFFELWTILLQILTSIPKKEPNKLVLIPEKYLHRINSE